MRRPCLIQLGVVLALGALIATALLALKHARRRHAEALLADGLRWIKDPDPEVRYRGALRLMKFREWQDVDTPPEAVVPALVGALRDESPGVRLTAAGALVPLGPHAKDAVPALGEALRDEDDRVGILAAQALGKIGPEARPAVPQLVAALQAKSGYWFLRASAAEALGQIGDRRQEVLAALKAAAKDEHPDIRVAASGALEALTPKALSGD